MPIKPRTWAIGVGGGLVGVIIVGAGIYAWRSSFHSPDPVSDWPAYTTGEGVAYCARLGELARQHSTLDTAIAVVLALLGSCAVIAGNFIEPGPPDAGRRVRNRGALVLNVGGLLLLMSYYEFSRADAASLTAASAAMAQADAARERPATIPPTPPDPNAPDRDAYVSCAVARATWLKSRVESSALAESLTSVYHGGKTAGSQASPGTER